MADRIAALPQQRVEALIRDVATPESARQQLHELAAELVSSTGQIRRGYLKISKTNAELHAGTRWSSSADRTTSDAVRCVRALVERGYQGTRVDIAKVNAALDAYVNAKGQRLGTHSFVKLVRELEASVSDRPDDAGGVTAQPVANDRVAGARVKADATLVTPALLVDRETLMQASPVEDLRLPEVEKVITDEADAPLEVIADEDVPPLKVIADEELPPPMVVQPLTRLSKSAQFSVDHAADLTAKKFNVLAGELARLGQAIDEKLLAQGLKAPRGVSRIELNGEQVYCYFDKAGKARAILPKGASGPEQARTIPVIHHDVPSKGYTDYFARQEGGFERYREDVENGGHRNYTPDSELKRVLKDSWKKDPDLVHSIRKDYGERGSALMQVIIAGNPWLFEMRHKPGGRMPAWELGPDSIPEAEQLYGGDADENIDAWYESSLVIAVPARGVLSEDSAASSLELKELAPSMRFDKNARARLDMSHRNVFASEDGSYVKKWGEVVASKADFFEHLLDQEESHPGIVNRLLVGVPTADNKKTISPLGAATDLKFYWPEMARKVRADPGYLEKFETAAQRAIVDLAVACRGGFEVPESKPEHFLMNPDPSLPRLEISMIDFGRGRNGRAAERKSEFERGARSLLLYVETFAGKYGLEQREGGQELLARLKERVDQELAQFA